MAAEAEVPESVSATAEGEDGYLTTGKFDITVNQFSPVQLKKSEGEECQHPEPVKCFVEGEIAPVESKNGISECGNPLETLSDSKVDKQEEDARRKGEALDIGEASVVEEEDSDGFSAVEHSKANSTDHKGESETNLYENIQPVTYELARPKLNSEEDEAATSRESSETITTAEDERQVVEQSCEEEGKVEEANTSYDTIEDEIPDEQNLPVASILMQIVTESEIAEVGESTISEPNENVERSEGVLNVSMVKGDEGDQGDGTNPTKDDKDADTFTTKVAEDDEYSSAVTIKETSAKVTSNDDESSPQTLQKCDSGEELQHSRDVLPEETKTETSRENAEESTCTKEETTIQHTQESLDEEKKEATENTSNLEDDNAREEVLETSGTKQETGEHLLGEIHTEYPQDFVDKETNEETSTDYQAFVEASDLSTNTEEKNLKEQAIPELSSPLVVEETATEIPREEETGVLILKEEKKEEDAECNEPAEVASMTHETQSETTEDTTEPNKDLNAPISEESNKTFVENISTLAEVSVTETEKNIQEKDGLAVSCSDSASGEVSHVTGVKEAETEKEEQKENIDTAPEEKGQATILKDETASEVEGIGAQAEENCESKEKLEEHIPTAADEGEAFSKEAEAEIEEQINNSDVAAGEKVLGTILTNEKSFDVEDTCVQAEKNVESNENLEENFPTTADEGETCLQEAEAESKDEIKSTDIAHADTDGHGDEIDNSEENLDQQIPAGERETSLKAAEAEYKEQGKHADIVPEEKGLTTILTDETPIDVEDIEVETEDCVESKENVEEQIPTTADEGEKSTYISPEGERETGLGEAEAEIKEQIKSIDIVPEEMATISTAETPSDVEVIGVQAEESLKSKENVEVLETPGTKQETGEHLVGEIHTESPQDFVDKETNEETSTEYQACVEAADLSTNTEEKNSEEQAIPELSSPLVVEETAKEIPREEETGVLILKEEKKEEDAECNEPAEVASMTQETQSETTDDITEPNKDLSAPIAEESNKTFVENISTLAEVSETETEKTIQEKDGLTVSYSDSASGEVSHVTGLKEAETGKEEQKENIDTAPEEKGQATILKDEMASEVEDIGARAEENCESKETLEEHIPTAADKGEAFSKEAEAEIEEQINNSDVAAEEKVLRTILTDEKSFDVEDTNVQAEKNVESNENLEENIPTAADEGEIFPKEAEEESKDEIKNADIAHADIDEHGDEIDSSEENLDKQIPAVECETSLKAAEAEYKEQVIHADIAPEEKGLATILTNETPLDVEDIEVKTVDSAESKENVEEQIPTTADEGEKSTYISHEDIEVQADEYFITPENLENPIPTTSSERETGLGQAETEIKEQVKSIDIVPEEIATISTTETPLDIEDISVQAEESLKSKENVEEQIPTVADEGENFLKEAEAENKEQINEETLNSQESSDKEKEEGTEITNTKDNTEREEVLETTSTEQETGEHVVHEIHTVPEPPRYSIAKETNEDNYAEYQACTEAADLSTSAEEKNLEELDSQELSSPLVVQEATNEIPMEEETSATLLEEEEKEGHATCNEPTEKYEAEIEKNIQEKDGNTVSNSESLSGELSHVTALHESETEIERQDKNIDTAAEEKGQATILKEAIDTAPEEKVEATILKGETASEVEDIGVQAEEKCESKENLEEHIPTAADKVETFSKEAEAEKEEQINNGDVAAEEKVLETILTNEKSFDMEDTNVQAEKNVKSNENLEENISTAADEGETFPKEAEAESKDEIKNDDIPHADIDGHGDEIDSSEENLDKQIPAGECETSLKAAEAEYKELVIHGDIAPEEKGLATIVTDETPLDVEDIEVKTEDSAESKETVEEQIPTTADEGEKSTYISHEDIEVQADENFITLENLENPIPTTSGERETGLGQAETEIKEQVKSIDIVPEEIATITTTETPLDIEDIGVQAEESLKSKENVEEQIPTAADEGENFLKEAEAENKERIDEETLNSQESSDKEKEEVTEITNTKDNTERKEVLETTSMEQETGEHVVHKIHTVPEPPRDSIAKETNEDNSAEYQESTEAADLSASAEEKNLEEHAIQELSSPLEVEEATNQIPKEEETYTTLLEEEETEGHATCNEPNEEYEAEIEKNIQEKDGNTVSNSESLSGELSHVTALKESETEIEGQDKNIDTAPEEKGQATISADETTSEVEDSDVQLKENLESEENLEEQFPIAADEGEIISKEAEAENQEQIKNVDITHEDLDAQAEKTVNSVENIDKQIPPIAHEGETSLKETAVLILKEEKKEEDTECNEPAEVASMTHETQSKTTEDRTEPNKDLNAPISGESNKTFVENISTLAEVSETETEKNVEEKNGLAVSNSDSASGEVSHVTGLKEAETEKEEQKEYIDTAPEEKGQATILKDEMASEVEDIGVQAEENCESKEKLEEHIPTAADEGEAFSKEDEAEIEEQINNSDVTAKEKVLGTILTNEKSFDAEDTCVQAEKNVESNENLEENFPTTADEGETSLQEAEAESKDEIKNADIAHADIDGHRDEINSSEENLDKQIPGECEISLRAAEAEYKEQVMHADIAPEEKGLATILTDERPLDVEDIEVKTEDCVESKENVEEQIPTTADEGEKSTYISPEDIEAQADENFITLENLENPILTTSGERETGLGEAEAEIKELVKSIDIVPEEIATISTAETPLDVEDIGVQAEETLKSKENVEEHIPTAADEDEKFLKESEAENKEQIDEETLNSQESSDKKKEVTEITNTKDDTEREEVLETTSMEQETGEHVVYEIHTVLKPPRDSIDKETNEDNSAEYQACSEAADLSTSAEEKNLEEHDIQELSSPLVVEEATNQIPKEEETYTTLLEEEEKEEHATCNEPSEEYEAEIEKNIQEKDGNTDSNSESLSRELSHVTALKESETEIERQDKNIDTAPEERGQATISADETASEVEDIDVQLKENLESEETLEEQIPIAADEGEIILKEAEAENQEQIKNVDIAHEDADAQEEKSVNSEENIDKQIPPIAHEVIETTNTLEDDTAREEVLETTSTEQETGEHVVHEIHTVVEPPRDSIDKETNEENSAGYQACTDAADLSTTAEEKNLEEHDIQELSSPLVVEEETNEIPKEEETNAVLLEEENEGHATCNEPTEKYGAEIEKNIQENDGNTVSTSESLSGELSHVTALHESETEIEGKDKNIDTAAEDKRQATILADETASEVEDIDVQLKENLDSEENLEEQFPIAADEGEIISKEAEAENKEQIKNVDIAHEDVDAQAGQTVNSEENIDKQILPIAHEGETSLKEAEAEDKEQVTCADIAPEEKGLATILTDETPLEAEDIGVKAEESFESKEKSEEKNPIAADEDETFLKEAEAENKEQIKYSDIAPEDKGLATILTDQKASNIEDIGLQAEETFNSSKNLESKIPSTADEHETSLKEAEAINTEQFKYTDIVPEEKGLANIVMDETSLDVEDIDVKLDEVSESKENVEEQVPTVSHERGTFLNEAEAESKEHKYNTDISPEEKSLATVSTDEATLDVEDIGVQVERSFESKEDFEEKIPTEDETFLKEAEAETKEHIKCSDIAPEEKGLADILTDETSLDVKDIEVKAEESFESNENLEEQIQTAEGEGETRLREAEAESDERVKNDIAPEEKVLETISKDEMALDIDDAYVQLQAEENSDTKEFSDKENPTAADEGEEKIAHGNVVLNDTAGVQILEEAEPKVGVEEESCKSEAQPEKTSTIVEEVFDESKITGRDFITEEIIEGNVACFTQESIGEDTVNKSQEIETENKNLKEEGSCIESLKEGSGDDLSLEYIRVDESETLKDDQKDEVKSRGEILKESQADGVDESITGETTMTAERSLQIVTSPVKYEEGEQGESSSPVSKEEGSNEDTFSTKVAEEGDDDNGAVTVIETSADVNGEEGLPQAVQKYEPVEGHEKLLDLMPEESKTESSSENAEVVTCTKEEIKIQNIQESLDEEKKEEETTPVNDTKENETEVEEVFEIASTEQEMGEHATREIHTVEDNTQEFNDKETTKENLNEYQVSSEAADSSTDIVGKNSDEQASRELSSSPVGEGPSTESSKQKENYVLSLKEEENKATHAPTSEEQTHTDLKGAKAETKEQVKDIEIDHEEKGLATILTDGAALENVDSEEFSENQIPTVADEGEYNTELAGDKAVDESFQVQSLEEAEPKLRVEDESRESEDHPENNTMIVEEPQLPEQVLDEPKSTGGDFSEGQTTESNAAICTPERIQEETAKNSQDSDKETENLMEEGSSIESVKACNTDDPSQEFILDDGSKKFDDNKQDTVKFEGEILKETEIAGVGESTTHETNQIAESSGEISGASPVKYEEGQPGEGSSQDSEKASKDEDVTEDDDNNGAVTVTESSAEVTSKGEEESAQALEKSEPEEEKVPVKISDVADVKEVCDLEDKASFAEKTTEETSLQTEGHAEVSELAPEKLDVEATEEEFKESSEIVPESDSRSIDVASKDEIVTSQTLDEGISQEQVEIPSSTLLTEAKEIEASQHEHETPTKDKNIEEEHEKEIPADENERDLSAERSEDETPLQKEESKELKASELALEKLDAGDTEEGIKESLKTISKSGSQSTDAVSKDEIVADQTHLEASYALLPMEEELKTYQDDRETTTQDKIIEEEYAKKTEVPADENGGDLVAATLGEETLLKEEPRELKISELAPENLDADETKEEIKKSFEKVSKSDSQSAEVVSGDETTAYQTELAGDKAVEESFQVQSLEEAEPKLRVEDESCESEDHPENNNMIVEEPQLLEQVLDEPKSTDGDSSEGQTTKRNAAICTPERIQEGTAKNSQDSDKETENSQEEILKEPEIAGVGESTTYETNQIDETSEEIFDASPVKYEEGRPGECSSQDSAKASKEEDVTEDDDSNGAVTVTESNAEVTSKGEEDSAQPLEKYEPEEEKVPVKISDVADAKEVCDVEDKSSFAEKTTEETSLQREGHSELAPEKLDVEATEEEFKEGSEIVRESDSRSIDVVSKDEITTSQTLDEGISQEQVEILSSTLLTEAKEIEASPHEHETPTKDKNIEKEHEQEMPADENAGDLSAVRSEDETPLPKEESEELKPSELALEKLNAGDTEEEIKETFKTISKSDSQSTDAVPKDEIVADQTHLEASYASLPKEEELKTYQDDRETTTQEKGVEEEYAKETEVPADENGRDLVAPTLAEEALLQKEEPEELKVSELAPENLDAGETEEEIKESFEKVSKSDSQSSEVVSGDETTAYQTLHEGISNEQLQLPSSTLVPEEKEIKISEHEHETTTQDKNKEDGSTEKNEVPADENTRDLFVAVTSEEETFLQKEEPREFKACELAPEKLHAGETEEIKETLETISISDSQCIDTVSKDDIVADQTLVGASYTSLPNEKEHEAGENEVPADENGGDLISARSVEETILQKEEPGELKVSELAPEELNAGETEEEIKKTPERVSKPESPSTDVVSRDEAISEQTLHEGISTEKLQIPSSVLLPEEKEIKASEELGTTFSDKNIEDNSSNLQMQDDENTKAISTAKEPSLIKEEPRELKASDFELHLTQEVPRESSNEEITEDEKLPEESEPDSVREESRHHENKAKAEKQGEQTDEHQNKLSEVDEKGIPSEKYERQLTFEDLSIKEHDPCFVEDKTIQDGFPEEERRVEEAAFEFDLKNQEDEINSKSSITEETQIEKDSKNSPIVETSQEVEAKDTKSTNDTCVAPEMKERIQVGTHSPEEKEATAISKEQQIEEDEEEEHESSEEVKVDEEKGEKEHKTEEPGYDSPIMVEASRDADVNVKVVSHKKSNHILSGIKHSISKVKKAITGKSSHSKTKSEK
ncbi:uncharacterized protein [Pyrus communis]|uniref:uncharacterized protein n=1 Tax=Pyrus communis TaxID=23211 RepID=UPI0035C1ADA5